MLRFLWKYLIRKVAPRQLDAFAGRSGRPDWNIILRRGLTQGFLGGSTPWLLLGGLAALLRLWSKVGEDHAKLLLVDHLGPGEALSIVDTGVQRRRVKKARRGAK